MKPTLAAVALAGILCSPPVRGETGFGSGEGVTGEVLAIATQKDGKVVIGGSFTAVNGVTRQNLARLNPDGSLDTSFIPQSVLGPNGPVAALLILPDGAILAGGNFETAGNLPRTDLVKFSSDGVADPSFGAQEGGVATNGSIAALALQPDGGIIVGGNFSTFYGKIRHGIARLNPDGSVAAAFRQSETLSGSVAALTVAPDGTAFAGGRFSDPSQNAHSILKPSR
jgi:uncharacterized delta-60 repeat protein